MSEQILYGPEDKSHIPKKSVGKLMFQNLKHRDPTSVAILDAFTNEYLTYGDVLRESVQLATALEAKGIAFDDKISIVSENVNRFCIPFLASLYIGAVTCPYNPVYMARELKHSMSLSRPKIVFCSHVSVKTVLEVKAEVNFIEEVVIFGTAVEGTTSYTNFLSNGSQDVNSFQPKDVDIDAVAAILSSSGTMGLPKGVMLTHRNLRGTFAYVQDERGGHFKEGEVTIGVLPAFHVFGVFIQMGAINYATKLVIMSTFKPDVFLTCIQKYRVTKLFLVPSIAQFLAKHPIVDNFDLSSIKDIYCAAAPLGADIQVLLEKRVGRVRQAYGLTEISGCATLQIRNVNKPGSSGPLVVGIVGKVLDIETKQILGPNQNGELCFKGPMVMKGYIGDDESTNLMLDEDGFLHTGDIGYFDEGGDFYVVDRLKELIKYKGFQVPPAELEDILITHPGIKEVGVVGKPDERSGELPIAFVVKQPNAQVTEQEIIDFLAGQVSEQKQLYGGVRFVDELPKTPVGKILRRKLRELL